MARFAGRGGAQDMAEAAALLEKAAKLGHVAAAYNLALLYLEGQQVRQDVARAAELLRGAADAGSPEAQYALATLYKEGNGVPKDPAAAAKLLAAAARTGNVAAEVEYAIALFNGTGTAKDESGAAALFRKAAHKGNAVAQNRLARILATGRGLPADPRRRPSGTPSPRPAASSDLWLEDWMQKIKDSRARGRRERRAALARARAAGGLTIRASCPNAAQGTPNFLAGLLGRKALYTRVTSRRLDEAHRKRDVRQDRRRSGRAACGPPRQHRRASRRGRPIVQFADRINVGADIAPCDAQ